MAQLLALTQPTGTVVDSCNRGVKRALTEPNILVDALAIVARFTTTGGTGLTEEEIAQSKNYHVVGLSSTVH